MLTFEGGTCPPPHPHPPACLCVQCKDPDGHPLTFMCKLPNVTKQANHNGKVCHTHFIFLYEKQISIQFLWNDL